MHPGRRRPRLYLARGTNAVKFAGANIDGYAAIAAESYTKNGDWSSTRYELLLAPGVRPIEFLSPLHGMWGDNLKSWGEACENLGLPVEVVQRIVRAEYPRTAARWDALEAFALACEQEGQQVEVVTVSFGSPTNRESRNGYWAEPKGTCTSDGRRVVVAPSDGERGWYEPVIVEPEGARIIDVHRRPGMHGGYFAIEVAVPISLPKEENE